MNTVECCEIDLRSQLTITIQLLKSAKKTNIIVVGYELKKLRLSG